MKIEIKALEKKYDNGFKALKGIDLEITEGMFGLLGPNGAGKSTLMKILVTMQDYTTGSILIDGKDIRKERREVRKIIGYLPQDFRFFTRLKTWEFLDYATGLSGMFSRKQQRGKVDEMLAKVGLYEVRDRYAQDLSGGMKRRLGIAQALITNPKMLVVDEPTTGLDPEERIRFRNLLSELGNQDTIIILSTHIVGDISSTCNQMAVLHEGEIAFVGSPEELIARAKNSVWQLHVSNSEYDLLKEKYPVISTIPADNGWEIQLVGDDIEGFEGKKIKPNLEHAYVHLMEYKLNAWQL